MLADTAPVPIGHTEQAGPTLRIIGPSTVESSMTKSAFPRRRLQSEEVLATDAVTQGVEHLSDRAWGTRVSHTRRMWGPIQGRYDSHVRVVLPVLFAVACGPAEAPERGPTVRDSAGIEIVESAEPAWGPGEVWQLSETPTLRIGSVEGAAEEQLFRVGGAHRFPDGRIAVANGGTHELRIYDPNGRLLVTAGGEGEGPGEFERVTSLMARGDSLYIHDSAAGRLSIFDASGRFVSSFSLPSIEGRPPAYAVGVFADGSLVVRSFPPFWVDAETGIQRPLDTYLRLSPTGAVLDTLGEFPGDETYLEIQGQGVASMRLPFPRVPVTAVGPDGFYYGSSDTWEIDYYSPEGRLERKIRLARPNRPVTPDDLERFIEELTSRIPDEDVGRALEAHYRRMPLPETMPAYSEALLDSEGNLWVADYRVLILAPTRWSVFDDHGRLLGTVVLPERFTPYQIGSDFVLGRSEDELGVEYVDLHSLEKT